MESVHVHAIQDQIKLVPLSTLQGNATSPVSPSLNAIMAAIKASDNRVGWSPPSEGLQGAGHSCFLQQTH